MIAKRAYDKAIADNHDVVLIDTSGRFHNNIGLMNEIKKIYTTLHSNNKLNPNNVILNIDATMGQINHDIVKHFTDFANVDGLFISKTDVTKPGIIISILHEYKIPIYGIGIGEKMTDIAQFSPEKFSKSFVGL